MPALYDSGFVVRDPAWHGLATVLANSPRSVGEALEAAGLDWSVAKAPIKAMIPTGIGDTVVETEVPDRFATYRQDTLAPLGVVGRDWTAVQNSDAFRFLDELVGGGELEYESVGALEGGAKVFIVARFPEYLEVGGLDSERVKRYLLVVNGHAGTLAFRIKNVHERVVCSNTLAIALGEQSDMAQFVARHSSGVNFRVNEARELMQISFKQDELYKEMAEQLLAVKLPPRTEQAFLERLVPYQITPANADSQKAKNVQAARDAVLAIMRNGEDLENIRGTAYGALQAATEYADWGTRVVGDGRVAQERRFKRNLLRDDPIKVRALKILAPEYARRARVAA